jgi:hypothetical protein
MKPEVTFKVTVTKGADTGKKLTLKAPADVSVKQGETAAIQVDITRDKFSDPVELKFAGLPAGVSIVENDRTLSKDATSAKLTLQAAADAKAVDDHCLRFSSMSPWRSAREPWAWQPASWTKAKNLSKIYSVKSAIWCKLSSTPRKGWDNAHFIGGSRLRLCGLLCG